MPRINPRGWERTSAVLLRLTGVVELTAGIGHTCARLRDGFIRCWGFNDYGQLGDGTMTNRLSPTLIPDL